MRHSWLFWVSSTFGGSMPRGGDVDMGVSSCIGADAAVRGATVPGYGDDIANASRAP
jgi:hypothetical protein